MENLNLTSVNINGLKKQKVDIIYIQETHIKSQHEHFLKNRKWASTNEKQKGMSIYITNQQINITVELKDPGGRYITLNIVLLMIIGSLYAPNNAKEKFYENFFQNLLDFHKGEVMILRDMNGQSSNITGLKVDEE